MLPPCPRMTIFVGVRPCRADYRRQPEARDRPASALEKQQMVTNAIRYGAFPIRLRLIRERGLIVEVFDGGYTSPHLRRASAEDEGGRGLFLVAQLTERWGTRYTPTGKTIWTEVPLTPPEAPDAFPVDAFPL